LSGIDVNLFRKKAGVEATLIERAAIANEV